MGRPLGSRNKPKDEAGIGDNSEVKELTLEQKRSLLMRACEQISPMKADVASIVAEMRALYKAYKADGIPKKDIDFALSLHNMDEAEVVALATRTARIIEWVHPGVQAEIDFEQAAE
jgi:hypothetical protein